MKGHFVKKLEIAEFGASSHRENMAGQPVDASRS
jgi:hypothetical protein